MSSVSKRLNQIRVGGHKVYAAQEIGYGNWHCAFRKLYGTYSPVHNRDPKQEDGTAANYGGHSLNSSAY